MKRERWQNCTSKRVNQMIKSAEGSAGLLHKITKPAEDEAARLLDRCEANRKALAMLRKCAECGGQAVENEELEEALPRLKECDLEKASRLYKAKAGEGCDGFHPKVILDLTKETRIEVVELLEKVEQSGKWPQQACTTMFFLSPKNVTSERLTALMPTLIR